MTNASTPTTTGRVAGAAVQAAQQALAAEHAAAWSYSLASAFLPASMAASVADGASAHRARRDGIERLIKDAGVTPVPAAASYTPPKPVNDANSAMDLLATAESDTAQGWRAVLESTDDRGLRQTALDGLTNSAVRGTRWRRAAGQHPATTAFPGQADSA